MKKILFILILITGWQLSSAQERFYVISSTQAKVWYQYKITAWYGIDPVQLKTGEWIISEKCYYEMTTEFINKDRTVDIKLRADSVMVILEKYPARKVLTTEFKEPTLIEEKLIPK